MDIAFLGTGLMGQPMVRRLLQAGHSVTVYNRTAAKARALQEAGAGVAEHPAEAILAAECIITMLTNADAICGLLLEDDARQALAGRTVLQMSTIAPNESRSLAQALAVAGGHYLEAPVLGSTPEAEAGKLIVMAGGPAEVFERWRAVLECFSPAPRHVGEVGSATALKLALNQLIAALTAGFALSLGFVRREGINVDDFMEILRGSALYAPTFDKKLPRMLKREFADPNFPASHLAKDVDLFLNEAVALGLEESALRAVALHLEHVLDRGLGSADYSALYQVIDPPDH